MVLRFFLFAGVFLFISCTEFDRNHPDDPGGVNYQGKSDFLSSSAQTNSSPAEISSSSITSSNSLLDVSSSSSSKVSSSNSRPSSSSNPISSGVIYGEPVYYEGEIYKTVVIGSQTWLQRNLNYAVEGSKCGGDDGKLKDENTVNCDKYGRLYNWATAMKLSASCNNSEECQVGAKHNGICPSGWHIPSNAEWNVLNGGSLTAGRYLKATSGWNSYNEQSGNGQDTYGFAALPGGTGSSGDFDDVGYYGYWWSGSSGGTYYAYGRYIAYDDESFFNRHDLNKSWLFSVRCVKD